jgi:Leucine-rich repeat (LRR) protein
MKPVVLNFAVLACFGQAQQSNAQGVQAGPDPFRTPEVQAILDRVVKLNGYEYRDRNAQKPILNLQFRNPGPKDADLEGLQPLLKKSPIPVSLNLNSSEAITDAGVAHLAHVATLSEVALGGTRVTNDGLKHLAALTQLQALYLSNDKITDDGLKHLSKLTNLRKLSIYSKGVSAAGFANLAGLVNLEEFHIGGIGSDIGDEYLAHMKGMTKLKDLTIGGDKLTDAGMVFVKNFTELRKLRIDSQKVTAAGVANLAPLTKLESLTVLYCPGFAGDGLAALKGMTALQELELIYLTPDVNGIAHLGKVASLKKLRLGTVRDETLGGLSGLKNLEELALYYSGLGDEGLKPIGQLTSLRELNVQNTRVSDAGLKHISGLKNLKRLSASDNKRIADAGLEALAGLENLEVLWVSDCKVTGSGLKHLAGLTKLKDLAINGNPVTDAGIAELTRLRSLKEVNLTGTRTSEEAAIALKKERPELRVRDLAGDEVVLNPRPAPKRAPAEDLAKAEPDFKLSVDQFYKEYEAGRNTAAEKYKNKVIELTGEVDGMGRNISGDAYVSIKLEKQLIGVMCFTAQAEPWAKVAKGQKVKLKGKWPEFAVTAALVNCSFTETGDYQAVALSAPELAKQYEADKVATTKKYDKRQLVITGVVEDREFNSVGAATFTLKGTDKVKVKCSFTAFEKDAAKKIKIGQTVKLIGEFAFNFGGETVDLFFCLPITEP